MDLFSIQTDFVLGQNKGGLVSPAFVKNFKIMNHQNQYITVSFLKDESDSNIAVKTHYSLFFPYINLIHKS